MPDPKKMPTKSMKLTPKRTLEVADSLMNVSNAKKENAIIQKRIGDATVKNNVANKQVGARGALLETLSGNDRLKIADKNKKEAVSDSLNSVRYRSLALKAMNKNK